MGYYMDGLDQPELVKGITGNGLLRGIRICELLGCVWSNCSGGMTDDS